MKIRKNTSIFLCLFSLSVATCMAATSSVPENKDTDDYWLTPKRSQLFGQAFEDCRNREIQLNDGQKKTCLYVIANFEKIPTTDFSKDFFIENSGTYYVQRLAYRCGKNPAGLRARQGRAKLSEIQIKNCENLIDAQASPKFKK